MGVRAAATMAGAAVSEYDISVAVAAKCVEKLSNDDTKKASLEPLHYTQRYILILRNTDRAWSLIVGAYRLTGECVADRCACRMTGERVADR